MICKKCGNPVQEGMKFCTSCGEPVVAEQNLNIQQSVTSNQQQVVQPNNIGVTQTPVQNTVAQPTMNVQQPAYSQNTMKSGKGIFKTILMGLIRPKSNFKESEMELSSTSNSFILTGIISAMIMVINLVISVCTTLFTKSAQTCFMGYCVGEDLSFADKFKSIQWWPLIWQYIVIPAGIILLIAGIYYIVSLIFKKNLNFAKLLSISALGVAPALVAVVLVSPLLGLMWAPASIIVSATGFIYSLIILLTLFYKEFNFEEDDKFILFNLISVFIIIVIAYFVVNQVIQQSITSSLGDFSSLF